MNKTLDLGKDPIKKLLVAFSIPCIISMLINSIYNIADQIFIGQGVGMLGNAATNVIFPLIIIFTGISQLIGNGAAAFLSLKLGEKKEEEARKGVANSIIILFLSSIILAIIAYIFLPQLISLFGSTPNVYPYAMDYGKIIVLGLPFMVIYTGLSAIIRADGSPRFSMISIVIGSIVNIILDPIFIFDWGLGLGIKGGAIATVIGQIISCIMTCTYLFKLKSIKLSRKDFKITKSIFDVCGMGLSSFITQITVVLIFVVMNNVMTKYGAQSIYGADIPLSVFGIVSKLNQVFIGIIIGLACGAQPIIGYNYGAGHFNRTKEVIKLVIIVGFIVGLVFTILFVGFPNQMVGIFGSSEDPLYNQFASMCCRIFLAATLLNSFQMSAGVMIQSLGKVAKSTFISISRQILLFIPLVLIMSYIFGIEGAIWAAVLSDVIAFILAFFIFRSEYKKLGKSHSFSTTLTSEKSISNNEKEKNSDNIIITISREFGSGGRYVGKLVAELLNLKFYDKELIKMVAEESGYTEEYVEENEQKLNKLAKFNLEYMNNITNDDNLYLIESNKIKEIAQKESCVIIGRCADYILKDNPNSFHFFIYSKEKDKINRAIKYYNLKEEDASKEIRKRNQLRANHYKHYTGQEWGKVNNYDLALNSDKLGVEKTAEIIKEFIEKVKENTVV